MSELPKGWEAPGFAEICDFNPKHDPGTDREQLVSFVPMPAVSDETGTIETPQDRPLSEIWKGYTHFQNGDVIFAKITPCMENGKSAVASDLTNGLACGSTEFHVLRPRG
jgi:type I restriction enzyme S subunit